MENGRLEKRSLCSRLVEWAVLWVGVESRLRSQAENAAVVSHYALDYLILWSVSSSIFNGYTLPLQSLLPFFIARLVLALLFVLTPRPLFFALGKLAVVGQVLSGGWLTVWEEGVAVACELLAAGVWALGKEQRLYHFDSRLGLTRTALKQTAIYLLLLGQSYFHSPNDHQNSEPVFLAIGVGLTVLLLDSGELFYFRQTQRIFLRLDQVNLFLQLLLLLSQLLNINYQEYVFVSVTLLALAALELANPFLRTDPALLAPLHHIQDADEQTAARYFVQVKMLLKHRSDEAIDSFLLQLAEQSTHKRTRQLFGSLPKETRGVKCEAVDDFIIEVLGRLARHSKLLSDLLLHLYLPDPRVYYLLQLHRPLHRREERRMLAERSVEYVYKEYEEKKQMQEVRQHLLSCVDLSHRLYRELMRERIEQQRVLDLAEHYIAKLQLCILPNPNGQTRCPKANGLVLRYLSECSTTYFQQLLAGAESAVQQQSGAELLLSLTDEGVGEVTRLNKAMLKLAGGKRLGRGEVVPLQLEAVLAAEARKWRGVQTEERQPLLIDLAWLHSKNGYVVPCSWKVSRSHSQHTRCIRIEAQPMETHRAWLLVSEQGRVAGISELARYYQFLPVHTGKPLEAGLVAELLREGRYSVRRGDKFIPDSAAADSSFQLRISARSSVLPEKLLLVELLGKGGARNALQEEINPREEQPIDFSFHFSWDAKITSFPTSSALPLITEQRSRVFFNCGDNITEMRFFRDKIDYKSNFEEERDCPSLPRQREENLPALQYESFVEKRQKQRASRPLWLKTAVGLLAVMGVLVCGASAALFANFASRASANSTGLNYVGGLYQRLQGAMRLGSLPLVSQLALGLDAGTLLREQLAQMSTLNQEIYSINQQAFTETAGPSILQQLNTMNLLINQFLLNNSSTNLQASLTSCQQIYPPFNTYIDSIVSTIASNNNSNTTLCVALLVVVTLLLVLFIAGLWVIEYRLGKQREEVVEVLKFMHNEYLTTSRDMAQRFKEIALQGGEWAGEQREEESEQQTQSHSKHVLRGWRVSIGKVMHVCWLALVLALLMLAKASGDQLNQTSQQHLEYSTHTARSISSLNLIWTLFTVTNPNPQTIAPQINYFFNEDYQKILSLRKIVTNPLSNFGSFYLSFWEKLSFCSYLNATDCSTIIGQGTSEGGSTLIAYINEQYDQFMTHLANGTGIQTYNDTPVVARVIYFYLSDILNANLQALTNDFELVRTTLWSGMIGIFAGLLLASVLLVGLCIYYDREYKRYGRQEEMIMTVPFEKLQKLPAFHRYYSNRYANL